MSNDPASISGLLNRCNAGDEDALGELMPLVYDELRRLARHYMRKERTDHTLQPTALVNEAFVRMVRMDVPWQNRAHFFAIAARSMRRILVDHAREQAADKRGGSRLQVKMPEGSDREGGRSRDAAEIIALNDALDQLATMDETKHRITELHHFGGLTQREIAEVMGISAASVNRDLRFAQAWLAEALNEGHR